MKNTIQDTYFTPQPRKLSISLSDEEIDRLSAKAGANGWTIAQLLENFTADLVCSKRTNGTDERKAAVTWIEYRTHNTDRGYSFLEYLIDCEMIEEFMRFSISLELAEMKKKAEEIERYQEWLNRYYQCYLSYTEKLRLKRSTEREAAFADVRAWYKEAEILKGGE